MAKATVAGYLLSRLRGAGVQHAFGVAGDYVLNFLDYLEKSPIQFISTCNELNASYAADAYARLKGLGVVVVTYDVGGLSAVNGIAGAMAERVPVMIISGSPGMNVRHQHRFFHHSVGKLDTQLKIFEKITCYSALIDNPGSAPRIIHEAMSHCIRYQKPVYLEIPSDLVSALCNPEGFYLSAFEEICDEASLNEAIEITCELLMKSKHPIIISDVEMMRYRLGETLKRLIEKIQVPFATTLLSKGILDERHELFIGNYETFLCQDQLDAYIEGSDFKLWLGGQVMDGHVSQIDPRNLICVYDEKVVVSNKVFYNIPVASFLQQLELALAKLNYFPQKVEKIEFQEKIQENSSYLSVDSFFDFISEKLTGQFTIIAETGDTLFGSALRILPSNCRYLVQSRYLSLGYATPAVLGASLAYPESRVVAFIGDGGFQVAAQEASSWIRYQTSPIVFIINNGGYVTEKIIHEGEHDYNELQAWNYAELIKSFGNCWSVQVTNMYELAAAWQVAKNNAHQTIFIEVQVDKDDASKGLKYLANKFHIFPQLAEETDIL